MKMRHPGAKLTDTLLPYTTLCRSGAEIDETSGDHDCVPLGCLRRERIVHDMEDTAAVEQIARQDAVLPIWLLDRKDREDGCRQACRDQRFQRIALDGKFGYNAVNRPSCYCTRSGLPAPRAPCP